jgi:transcriptional regulator with XRE-family HTH domain
MKKQKKLSSRERQAPQGLASNIRNLRKARGWSQTALAERIGAHLSHVNRVETGKYTPSLDFIVKVAEAFGVTVDDIVADQNDVLKEVRVEDKELSERIRLLESLDKKERDAIITVIDSMLTKKKMLDLLTPKNAVNR